MKKQYTAPALQEVIIGMKSLLCASPTATMSGEKQSNDVALGRGTYWDEDDDDDY